MLNEWQAVTPPTADREEVDGIIAGRWQDAEQLEEAQHALTLGNYPRALDLIHESERG